MLKVLVLGASGATGKHLVLELLQRGFVVTAAVRSASSLQRRFSGFQNYREVQGNISEMPGDVLAPHIDGCDAVFFCLGHNLTFRGIFGEPRRLVTGAVSKICSVISDTKPNYKVKVILMNTTGNANADIPEVPPLSQRILVSIVRTLLPPHADNELAADFLRSDIGQDNEFIEWVVARPGGLVEESETTEYTAQPSPCKNVIFNDGRTSRINVANFMARLAAEPELWATWKGQMPVIYNAETTS